jgi:uncharacterized protein YecE (DUF72 family)
VKEISDFIKIGTCSWKYPSWEGILYSQEAGNNYLSEYAKHYDTVEIDQWFWSLFPGNKVVLPKVEVVKEYVYSVPKNFKFSIKVPNSITLTHHYSQNKNIPLIKNPFFLSNELFTEFYHFLEPMKENIAALIFQFEYLNKKKMSDQQVFQEKFSEFISKCPSGVNYCVEIRNPNYLNKEYFTFLKSSNLSHVFLQGYYMPPIFTLYEKYRDLIEKFAVIRLLGRGRKEIEDKSQGNWNKLLDPKDIELDRLAKMMNDLMIKNVRLFINVNNHYEGSAPLTIKRIVSRL